MPFSSSEIRWFSEEEKVFRQFFDELPGNGDSAEPTRTDYYLRTDSFDTGVKIRDGNHEVKVKTAINETLDYGVIEHWMKWSVSESQNILTVIDHELLNDWVEVRKIRFKKNFNLNSGLLVFEPSGNFLKEGCGVELTTIELPQLHKTFYTFGLEAFSSQNRCRENLLLTLNNLNADFSRLQDELSCGYPQWLSTLLY